MLNARNSGSGFCSEPGRHAGETGGGAAICCQCGSGMRGFGASVSARAGKSSPQAFHFISRLSLMRDRGVRDGVP
jgi:hypothetical protein